VPKGRYKLITTKFDQAGVASAFMCRAKALFFRAAEHGISEAKGLCIEPPFRVIACDVADTVGPEQMRVQPLPLLEWSPALGLENRVMQVGRMGQKAGFS
jgi:hypothetical protein